jgi:hypothetical protein
MPRHPGGERFEIVLAAQAGEVPPAGRLKGLLKAALRAWGLRCLSVRDVTPPQGTPQAAQDATDGAEATDGASGQERGVGAR